MIKFNLVKSIDQDFKIESTKYSIMMVKIFIPLE